MIEKFLLLIFLTTGMDVERFDSLKDCQMAAEAFTANYCKAAPGYFEQVRPMETVTPKIMWFVCGKPGPTEPQKVCRPGSGFGRIPRNPSDPSMYPVCEMKQSKMTWREYHLSGVHRRPLLKYRAGCFQSAK